MTHSAQTPDLDSNPRHPNAVCDRSESGIPPSIQARLQHLEAENRRLRAILDEFEATCQTLFGSVTWRGGRLLARLPQILGLLPRGSAEEHVAYLLREYHALDGLPGGHGSTLVGRWATLRRLLNRNTILMTLAALREIPKTGVRGFIGRGLAYLELNRLEVTIADNPNLGETLRLLRIQSAPPPAMVSLDTPIDIVVPIYNGLDYLQALLPRIIANTDLPYRLILIDDASPDPEVVAYLQDFVRQHPETLLLRNPVNLGFVATVNKGFELARGHFVILNQDTEVPPAWLSRLMRPLLEWPRVATVTPYTNAGSICSFPDFLEDCPRFDDLSTEALDTYFQRIDADAIGPIELPTGIGFCMAINKEAAEAVGAFDAVTFGRGYGEENDWCQRAIAAGYRNLMAPNLFVYHKHGGVFDSIEKQRLIADNLAKVNRRHPSYPVRVNRFIARDPLRALRELLLMLVANQASRTTHLVIDHALGGGANSFIDARRDEWLQDDHIVMRLAYQPRQMHYGLDVHFRTWHHAFALSDADELLQLAELIRFDAIHLNSLVAHPDVEHMLALIGQLKAGASAGPLIFYLHDYHAICPVYTLLDQHGRYCGVPADLAVCKSCLRDHRGEFRVYHPDPDALDIRRWRAAWGALLSLAERILCFSQASADILRRAYPDPRIERALCVEPHRTPPLITAIRQRATGASRPLTIGVLGAINFQKGIGILAAMARRIARERLNIRICVIGYTSEPLPDAVATVTGRYERAELPALVRQHGIDLFFLPSIWPETYLFTADEVMMLGLPLAVFDLGAPVERISSYRPSLIIEQIDPDVALEAIIDFAERERLTVSQNSKTGIG